MLLRGLAGCDPIETPISAVYVGSDTVWKLRKAVRLTFLDFTTLAERERTARREFELNAPNAAGLYRDVVAVTRSGDGVELDGDGEPVDWVVRMARVPETDFLDAIATDGGLTPTLLDALADTVAAMHQRLKPSATDATLRETIVGNRASAHAAGLPAERVDRWCDAMLARHAALAGWLALRHAAGFVRRTHGDLHLGNLCLWQGKPVAFDAMEFSETMATIDLCYDLAFLLMDLEVRVGRPTANRVLNRYVARTGDVGLVAGLPMFLSLRAMVRAHVTAHDGKDWTSYLDTAEAALRPSPAVVVGIGGLPGTGKSTLARALAARLGPSPGALVLRSDEARKRRFGVPPEQRLARDAYAEPVNRAVMAEIFGSVAAVSAAGHAVIADMSFLASADRKAVRIAAGGVAFIGLWLQAPPAVLEARIAARTGDASDADIAVLRRLSAVDPGPIDWHVLDATDAGRLETEALDILAPHVTKLFTAC